MFQNWVHFGLNLYWGLPLWGWLALLVFLATLTYTLLIIKNEKSQFLFYSNKFHLGPFLFLTPSWWDLKEQGPEKISFERKKTNYGWVGEFIWDKREENKTCLTYLEDLLSEFKFVFDEDVEITSHLPPNFLSAALTQKVSEFCRMEGKATQDQDTRVYLDFCAFKMRGISGIFLGKSSSSVLSGTIEGPFFEDVLKNLKLIERPHQNEVSR